LNQGHIFVHFVATALCNTMTYQNEVFENFHKNN